MATAWEERMRRKAAALAAVERAKVRDVFLDTVSKGLSDTAAAKAAGETRAFFMKWKAEDQEFAAACADAEEQGTDYLVDQAVKRATVGWQEPVFSHGKEIGTKTVYDSMLHMALLNARRPEKFKRSTRAEPAAKGGKVEGAEAQRERILAKLRAVSPRKV